MVQRSVWDRKLISVLERDFANEQMDYPPVKFTVDTVVKLADGGSVLDAGCGIGRFSNLLKPHGLKYLGIDTSKEFIEHCQGKFPDIKFRCMDVKDMKFKDGSFDVVLSSDVLVHLYDFADALREMYRVSRRFVVCKICYKSDSGIVITHQTSDFGGEEFRYPILHFSTEEFEECVANILGAPKVSVTVVGKEFVAVIEKGAS